MAEGLIDRTATVLDYGCGRGDDVRMLRRRRINAYGWDPSPLKQRFCFSGALGETEMKMLGPYDIVNLGFVLNVIENPKERARVLRRAYKLAKKVLIVSVRLKSDRDYRKKAEIWRQYQDGYITGAGTFQKFYTQFEFKQCVEDTLRRSVVMAAPGIAYVFRSRALERLYLTLRYHQQPSVRRAGRGASR